MRIRSSRAHFTRVGRLAALKNIPVDRVYTIHREINVWIDRGYAEIVDKRKRQFNRQFRMICSKAMI